MRESFQETLKACEKRRQLMRSAQRQQYRHFVELLASGQEVANDECLGSLMISQGIDEDGLCADIEAEKTRQAKAKA